MDCILQQTNAKNLASGTLKANATVINKLAKIIEASGSVKANVGINITMGFREENSQPLFGQTKELLFGAATPQPVVVTRSENRLSCTGSFRILNSRQYLVNDQIYTVDNESDILAITVNNARVLDVVNPYSEMNPRLDTSQDNSNLSAFLTLSSNNLESKILAVGQFRNTYTDKIAGNLSKIKSIPRFRATQKLYPIKDIVTSSNDVYFVNKDLSSGNIYQSVDEGLAIGNYTDNGDTSTRISDDVLTFIQPSSIYSQGDFTYKCEVLPPTITPKESFLFIRAAAPLISYESDVPAIYKIHNIKLEDPSGNLIAKYKDITFRGDGNYLREDQHNFTTYVTEPEVNYASLYTWEPKFPILGEASGYTLNLDFTVDCIHNPFSRAFSVGYEDECKLDFVDTNNNDYLALDGSPLSTRTQGYELNPNNSLRISCIEICNSGAIFGLLNENYIGFHTEVQPTGNRLERIIYPYNVLSSDFDTGIYPVANSVWESSPDIDGNISTNTSNSGQAVLTDRLRNLFTVGHITLDSTSSITNSGKLQLQYRHEPPFGIKQQTGGAFGFGGKGKNKSLNSSVKELVYGNDVFFTIDSIELQISARKAVGSPDYTIDVVGYSDDGVINITPAVGGFLQNNETHDPNNNSLVPVISGQKQINELAISAETLSDKDQYFEQHITLNPAKDHYVVSTSPVINSTSFQNYTIPLKIYQDSVDLGSSKDYSMSSFFENLYIDIYPLPSGASFSKANLVIKYKPSNAMPLYTFGYQEQELARREIKIYPLPRKSKDNVLNAVWTDAPLSLIEDIPQGYKAPTTIKTNYSRRWRGVEGSIFSGPFDPLDFSFAFYNPQLEEPFLNGYFDFNKLNGNILLSSYDGNLKTSGIISGASSNSLIRNIGLRFNNSGIFDHQERLYKTLDWTSTGHELYGHILDSFDNALRVSGVSCNIDFGYVNVSSGFSIFTRFCPDSTISGVNYNLFNSGVIASKWDSGENLEFTLGYNNGYLCANAKDTDGNIITVQDSLPYTEYQYPLSIILTYNDNNSRKLKLYTDNELASGSFDVLRASSIDFNLIDGNSSLVFGYSSGSGVGINGFISEIGISQSNASGTNITENNTNSRLQQVEADKFLATHRAKFWNNGEAVANDRYQMWQYVNEDTDQWHLGAFKYCDFFSDYDTLTTRIGKDFIVHNFTTSGDTYANLTNIPLPSTVPASNLAYHSQLENDMLRFNLGGNTNRLFSVAPRITKALPRSYSFNENGFVVDTILQHETTNNIIWEDGTVGPRLIVSLYTKAKDSDLFDTTNWGLINRSIHHIGPQECWSKISSKFTLGSLTDKYSEPWSNFVTSRNVTELNHKFFSKDVDEMFLQYDLVYPSGHYESKIKIHSTHVKLEDALLKAETLDSLDFNLAISGEAREREVMPLSLPNTFGSIETSGNGLTMYASGYLLIPDTGSMPLCTSGTYLLDNNVMPLHSVTVGFIGQETTFTEFNFGSSETQLFGSRPFYGPTLFVAGRTDKYDDKTLGLYIQNNQTQTSPSANERLVLFTCHPPITRTNYFTLSVQGGFPPLSDYTNSSAPLYVSAPLPDPISSGTLPFIIDAFNPNIINIKTSLPLMVFNESTINAGLNQLESFLWHKDNVGKDITVQDNDLALFEANNEIRGVQTVCYGECDTVGTCQELAVITHDTKWLENTCVDGGVLRASRTYTNLDVGFSGNFYGIRKFDKLIPQAPYNITIIGKTGSSGIIDVPREMSEWEYGYNEDVGYSGFKIVPSELERQANDKYGKSVAVKGDLMAIGAPFHNIQDTDGYELRDAGAVFVYRRNPEPSGFDWSNQLDKSPWSLEAKLSLPDGFKRDYYSLSPQFFFQNQQQLPFVGIDKNWIVGQEGRQLGHSVSIAKTTDREIIAVGGPSCSWSRVFGDVQAQPINIGLFIFTDEFLPTFPYPCRFQKPCDTYETVLNIIKQNDILFKYFCDPAVSFNVQIIICEPILGTTNDPSPDFSDPKPEFIKKFQINRHTFYKRNTEVFRNKNTQVFNDLKSVFESVFPYDETKIHNNIPPILGFYIDNTITVGSRAVQPALDQFIDYYKAYSYASGLKDFNDVPASGYASITTAIDENWVAQARTLITETLDTGKMVDNNTFKLFANNLGQFNPNISEFNTPPSSGGSVYIYENNGKEWEIIQEIKSPTTSNSVPPDRFGHAVSISASGNILVVGSPYIEEAVSIYEYRPEIKEQKYFYFPSWLSSKAASDTSFGYLFQLNRRLQSLLSTSNSVANSQRIVKQVYLEMSPSGKFEFRKNLDLKEYELIKTMTYSDIKPATQWEFLFETFAPTSRLGYSVASNEDGSLVAVGAPTDSMGAQDNASIWWKPGFSFRNTHWYSYVNAGAVRLLESRNYYPHDKVVEYGKFGNLHELLSPDEDSSFFNHMKPIYNNDFGLKFEKTSFAETEIPKDAGTLFIITPAIDAASNEIIDKIQDWLSLGDRNLVLVGNDPIWENDGAYASSNLIINYILSRLDSRMRLHPARNRYESLVNSDLGINIGPSLVPKGTTYSYVYPSNLRGSGVADIRIHYPGLYSGYRCDKPRAVIDWGTGKPQKTYIDFNNKCEMQLTHNGDIRAKFRLPCGDDDASYEMNLALYFGSTQPFCPGDSASGGPEASFPLQQYEPIPIMAALEQVSREIIYPAIPETREFRNFKEFVGQVPDGKIKVFSEIPDSGIAFIWSSESGNYSNLNINIGGNANKSTFIDPLEYNGKDALLMSTAEVKADIVNTNPVISQFNYAAEEKYQDTSSSIILIAGTVTEDRKALTLGLDTNLNFYGNMVAKNAEGGAIIAQLGGWTNRNTFKDGNHNSDLFNKLSGLGNLIDQNVSTRNLSIPSNGYDVGWIANTDQIPTQEDIDNIKLWLGQGNKKLIITYGQEPADDSAYGYDPNSTNYTVAAANAVTYLCEQLGISMRPLFLRGRNKYANKSDATSRNAFKDFNSTSIPIFINKEYRPIYRGKRIGLIPDSTIDEYLLPGPEQYSDDVIPIELNSGIALAYFGAGVIDDSFVENGIPQLKTGIAKVTFPVIGGSGYRVYFNTVSESPLEKALLGFQISDCSSSPETNIDNRGITSPIYDFTVNDEIFVVEETGIGINIAKNRDYFKPTNYRGDVDSYAVNIRVPVVASSISIYIDGTKMNYPSMLAPDTIRTQRLVSISGALLPIDDVITFKNVFRDRSEVIITPAVPERRETLEYLREISTSSEKYCPTDFCKEYFKPAPEIADGPLVVAQELYHQRPFDAGVAKSRITLISDPSIIQGRTIAQENGNINPSLVSFLGSLYPRTDFPNNNYGRQYYFINKIIAPERGSPQKYVNAYNNSGLNLRFNGTTNSALPAGAFSDQDYLIDATTPSYKGPMLPELAKGPTFMQPKDMLNLDPEFVRAVRQGEIQQFDDYQYRYGGAARFSGVINGKMYSDASVYGGMPQLMKDTGYDYLDFDQFPSGYPGDLFGYSLAIKNNKVYVGAPFAAYSGENFVSWNTVQANTPTGPTFGTEVGFNGGAGSVFVFEKTYRGVGVGGQFVPWQCVKKFRPKEINVGNEHSIITDQFGYSISIDGDILAIGAPGHDYDNYIIDSQAEFIRKEFNEQFDLQTRKVYNLGSQENRNLFGSGLVVQNNGAVFTYENKIDNWGAKTQSWVPIHKIVPQGYNAKVENDFFGKAISLDRSRRKDADYTLAIGSPQHQFGSGIGSAELPNAGAVYTYDGMLRKLKPSFAHPDSYITGRVFGDMNVEEPYTYFDFSNGNLYDNMVYFNSVVTSNNKGEIFLDVFGQDKIDKGFIIHRPYVDQIKGSYLFGVQAVNYSRLFIGGRPMETASILPMFNQAVGQGNVYNTLGLYENAVLGLSSGTPLGLYTSGNMVDSVESSGLNLFNSGSEAGSGIVLNLNIRGK
jgi:hypothetical protein